MELEWKDDLDAMAMYEDDLDADALEDFEEGFIRGYEGEAWL